MKQLQENADREGVKESQYLRMLITNRPRDYPEIRDEIARLSNEINHIGVNINQIAHRVNRGTAQAVCIFRTGQRAFKGIDR